MEFTCRNILCDFGGFPQKSIGIISECTQSLNIDTDEYSNLDIGDSLYGYCLCCGSIIDSETLKSFRVNASNPILEEVANSYEDSGCEDCGTIPKAIINKIRLLLGWQPL